MPPRTFYVLDSELDNYQVQVINKRTDNSFIVKGCAGSGKSILALWKAKQIQTAKKGTCLYIVFTKALMKYMEEGISQIGISDGTVVLYHDWIKTCEPADYIIVDEATDFTKDDILLFKEKARKALLLYGDSAQQLYAFKEGRDLSMEEIATITKFPMEQLVFNHRLPKKIARFAEWLNSENDDLADRCTEEGTEKPKILEYDSLEEQYDAIINLIRNSNMEDVGILFRNNEEVKRAYYYFQNKGVNVEAKFKKPKEGKNIKEDIIDLNFRSSNPKLMTYHSSKGLQFEYVFIPDCSEDKEGWRNPLYVAITRTYKGLYIMHSGNLSSFFDPVPTDLYDTSVGGGNLSF